jgi:hypothetical protein
LKPWKDVSPVFLDRAVARVRGLLREEAGGAGGQCPQRRAPNSPPQRVRAGQNVAVAGPARPGNRAAKVASQLKVAANFPN